MSGRLCSRVLAARWLGRGIVPSSIGADDDVNDSGRNAHAHSGRWYYHVALRMRCLAGLAAEGPLQIGRQGVLTDSRSVGRIGRMNAGFFRNWTGQVRKGLLELAILRDIARWVETGFMRLWL